FTVHVATQRGLATRRPHRHPRRVQPVPPMRERHCRHPRLPRGVAPIRHLLTIRDTRVAHTGEETPSSPHHATGCATHPSSLFSPPGYGFSTRDARWKPLI